MKISIYAETSLLELIATGQSLEWVSSYSFQIVIDDKSLPEGKFLCGEVELALPLRDEAVMLAQRAIQAEAAGMAKYFEERLAKLLALTWEAPK